jgi:hypothetical protein
MGSPIPITYSLQYINNQTGGFIYNNTQYQNSYITFSNAFMIQVSGSNNDTISYYGLMDAGSATYFPRGSYNIILSRRVTGNSLTRNNFPYNGLYDIAYQYSALFGNLTVTTNDTWKYGVNLLNPANSNQNAVLTTLRGYGATNLGYNRLGGPRFTSLAFLGQPLSRAGSILTSTIINWTTNTSNVALFHTSSFLTGALTSFPYVSINKLYLSPISFSPSFTIDITTRVVTEVSSFRGHSNWGQCSGSYMNSNGANNYFLVHSYSTMNPGNNIIGWVHLFKVDAVDKNRYTFVQSFADGWQNGCFGANYNPYSGNANIERQNYIYPTPAFAMSSNADIIAIGANNFGAWGGGINTNMATVLLYRRQTPGVDFWIPDNIGGQPSSIIRNSDGSFIIASQISTNSAYVPADNLFCLNTLGTNAPNPASFCGVTIGGGARHVDISADGCRIMFTVDGNANTTAPTRIFYYKRLNSNSPFFPFHASNLPGTPYTNGNYRAINFKLTNAIIDSYVSYDPAQLTELIFTAPQYNLGSYGNISLGTVTTNVPGRTFSSISLTNVLDFYQNAGLFRFFNSQYGLTPNLTGLVTSDTLYPPSSLRGIAILSTTTSNWSYAFGLDKDIPPSRNSFTYIPATSFSLTNTFFIPELYYDTNNVKYHLWLGFEASSTFLTTTQRIGIAPWSQLLGDGSLSTNTSLAYSFGSYRNISTIVYYQPTSPQPSGAYTNYPFNINNSFSPNSFWINVGSVPENRFSQLTNTVNMTANSVQLSALYVNNNPYFIQTFSTVFSTLSYINYTTPIISTIFLSTLMSTNWVDIDISLNPTNFQGLAIIYLSSPLNANWQVSTTRNIGASWSNLRYISANNVLLLDISPSTLLRFCTINQTVSSFIQFIPWDRTQYTPFQTGINLSLPGTTGFGTPFGDFFSTYTIAQAVTRFPVAPYITSDFIIQLSSPINLDETRQYYPITTSQISTFLGNNVNYEGPGPTYGLALIDDVSVQYAIKYVRIQVALASPFMDICEIQPFDLAGNNLGGADTANATPSRTFFCDSAGTGITDGLGNIITRNTVTQNLFNGQIINQTGAQLVRLSQATPATNKFINLTALSTIMISKLRFIGVGYTPPGFNGNWGSAGATKINLTCYNQWSNIIYDSTINVPAVTQYPILDVDLGINNLKFQPSRTIFISTGTQSQFTQVSFNNANRFFTASFLPVSPSTFIAFSTPYLLDTVVSTNVYLRVYNVQPTLPLTDLPYPEYNYISSLNPYFFISSQLSYSTIKIQYTTYPVLAPSPALTTSTLQRYVSSQIQFNQQANSFITRAVPTTEISTLLGAEYIQPSTRLSTQQGLALYGALNNYFTTYVSILGPDNVPAAIGSAVTAGYSGIGSLSIVDSNGVTITGANVDILSWNGVISLRSAGTQTDVTTAANIKTYLFRSPLTANYVGLGGSGLSPGVRTTISLRILSPRQIRSWTVLAPSGTNGVVQGNNALRFHDDSMNLLYTSNFGNGATNPSASLLNYIPFVYQPSSWAFQLLISTGTLSAYSSITLPLPRNFTLTLPISPSTLIALSTSATGLLTYQTLYGQTRLLFGLWNQTGNTIPGLLYDTSYYNGLTSAIFFSSPFSFSTFQLGFSTFYANTAPYFTETLSTFLPNFSYTAPPPVFSTTLISTLLGINYNDPDLILYPNNRGFVIWYLSTGNARLEISTPASAGPNHQLGWSSLRYISATNALCIDISPSTFLRFIPDGNITQSTFIEILPWDRTQFNVLNAVNASQLTGGTNTFGSPVSTFFLYQIAEQANFSPYLPNNNCNVVLSSLFSRDLYLTTYSAITLSFTTDRISTLLSNAYGDLNPNNPQGFLIMSTFGVPLLVSTVGYPRFSTIPNLWPQAALPLPISPQTQIAVQMPAASAQAVASTFRFFFRLWDQTDNATPGLLQDVSYLTGVTAATFLSSPYSVSTFSLWVSTFRTDFVTFLSSPAQFSTFPMSTTFGIGYNFQVDDSYLLTGIATTDISSFLGPMVRRGLIATPNINTGFVLTSLPTTAGTWYYTSSFSLATPMAFPYSIPSPWTPISPAFNEYSSLTLNTHFSTRIAFVPLLNVTSTYTFKLRLWDSSDGVPILSTVDTSWIDLNRPANWAQRLLSTPYSASTITIQVSTIRVPNAPVLLQQQIFPLSTVYADNSLDPIPFALGANLFSTILTNFIEYDATRGYSAQVGFAFIEANSNAFGYWQVSGPQLLQHWSSLTNISPTNSFILPATNDYAIRFIPTSNYTSTFPLSFYAWKQSQFGAYSTVNISQQTSRGRSSAFSLVSATFLVSSIYINAQPYFPSTLLFSLSSQYALVDGPAVPQMNPYGTSIATMDSLIGNRYSEINTNDTRGYAIIGATREPFGIWYWASSIQGGNPIFSEFLPPVSQSAAFLIDARSTNVFRFYPSATLNSTFQAQLIVRAWDKYDGYSNGTSNVDLSFMINPTNTSTSYSRSTTTFTTQLLYYNFAPVLSFQASTLMSNVEGIDLDPPGLTTSLLLSSISSAVSDLNPTNPRGIVITRALSTGMGAWQIRTPALTSWSTLHILSDTSPGIALISSPTSFLRFLPGLNSNSTVSLEFRIWDQTEFAELSSFITALTPTQGSDRFLSTSFSYSTALLYFSVTHINNAPFVQTGNTSITLTSSFFEQPGYKGDDVSSIIGYLSTNYRELDTTDARGIAIIATEGIGRWMFSSLQQPWTEITPTPTSAFHLSSMNTTYVMFSTSQNVNATAKFTFRLWDVTNTVPDQSYANITATGGRTAYSPQIVSAITTTLYMNHAPVLSPNTILQLPLTFGDPTYQLEIPQLTIQEMFTTIDANSWYSDRDPDPRGLGIVYAPSTATGIWQFQTIDGPWVNYDITGAQSTLLLTATGPNKIRFYSYSNIVSTYFIKFVAWDQTNSLPNGTFTSSFNRGVYSPFSLQEGLLFVSTSEVNYAPILQPNTTFFASSLICRDTTALAANTGINLSTMIHIIQPAIADSNTSSLQGIAITYAPSTFAGYWDILPGNPAFYSPIDYFTLPSITTPLQSFLLPLSSIFIRFNMNANFNATSTFFLKFRIWDQTQGAPWGIANTLPPNIGLSTAFSEVEGTLYISTFKTNEPPRFQFPNSNIYLSSVFGILPQEGNSVGDIFTLLDGRYFDPNAEDKLGLALFNVLSNSFGYWQISTTSFAWSTIQTTAPGITPTTYYLLPSSYTTQLRFVATANIDALQTIRTLLWDQTTYSNFSLTTIDTANYSTPVSPEFNTLVVSTFFINYAPSSGVYSLLTPYQFLGNNSNNIGVRIVDLCDAFQITDLNTSPAKGIAIRIFSTVTTSAFNVLADGLLQYTTSTDPNTGWQSISIAPFTDPSVVYLLPADTTTRIRVSTFSNTFAEYFFAIYAWDQYIGTPYTFTSFNTLATTSPYNGAVSELSSIFSMNMTFVYTAPKLLDAPVDLPPYPALPQLNSGYTVSTAFGYLGQNYINPDFNRFGVGRGVGIFDVAPRDPTTRWEFTMNGGSNWHELSTTINLQLSSLLLKGASTFSTLNQIRCVPLLNKNYNCSISFYGWDERDTWTPRVESVNGDYHFIDPLSVEVGGDGPFSASTASLLFSINQVYFAPSTNFSSFNFGIQYADNIDTPGQPYALASDGLPITEVVNNPQYNYRDFNLGITTRGLAIFSTVGTNGEWFYSDDQENWILFQPTPPWSSFVLPQGTFVRFHSAQNVTQDVGFFWSAFSPFPSGVSPFTYTSSVLFAGQNGPFSPSNSYPRLFPLASWTLQQFPLAPNINTGTFNIPDNDYRVTWDNATNNGITLQKLLSYLPLAYTDSYTTSKQGLLITPVPYATTGPYQIKGDFSASIIPQTIPLPFTGTQPATLFLFSTATVNPILYFTMDGTNDTFNKSGFAAFSVRGWNGYDLNETLTPIANGTIRPTALPSFTPHAPFSQNSFTFIIKCSPSQSVPTFTVGAAIQLPPVFENKTNTSYITVTLMSNTITDVVPDVPGNVGFFFANADSTNGSWYYTLDAGLTETKFTLPTPTSVLLLSNLASAGVRFVPNPNFSGTATISYGIYDLSRITGRAPGTITTRSLNVLSGGYSLPNRDISVSQKVSQYIPPGYPVEIFLSTFSQVPAAQFSRVASVPLTNSELIKLRSREYVAQFVLIEKSINPYFSFYFRDHTEYALYKESLTNRYFVDTLTRSPNNPAPQPTDRP